MKISWLLIGKTDFDFVKQGMNEYAERITKYAPFSISVLEGLKKTQSYSIDQIRIREGEMILRSIRPSDWVVLMDEKGTGYSSMGFATQMEKWMQQGKDLVFVTGGAYGFSKDVYARANQQLSLSKMTFSHQLVRVLFAEQLYRAFSIIRKEPYHHE